MCMYHTHDLILNYKMTTKLTHIIFLPYSTLIFRKFKSKWKNRRVCKISMAILAIHVKNFPITRSVFSLITFLQESKSEARASCLNIWVSAFNIINWLFSNYSPQMGMSHPCFRQNTFPYLPVRVSYKPKQLQALKMKKGRELTFVKDLHWTTHIKNKFNYIWNQFLSVIFR